FFFSSSFFSSSFGFSSFFSPVFSSFFSPSFDAAAAVSDDGFVSSFFSSFLSGMAGPPVDFTGGCIADCPSPMAVTKFLSFGAGGLTGSFFLFFFPHPMRMSAICESKLMVMSSVASILLHCG
ncbi:hypothetical protein PFISCL1PPCAC_15071, partial [Pristionchus fissidentatus]